MSKPANVVCDGDVCRVVKPDEAPAGGSASMAELLGPELLGKSGKVATSSLFGPNKYIAIYFRWVLGDHRNLFQVRGGSDRSFFGASEHHSVEKPVRR